MDNQKDKKAELVLLNALVYTVDKNRSRCEAVAVAEGRILAAGSNDEIKQYIEDSTEVIDLDGKLVLPAFVDTHMHPAENAVVYCCQIHLHEYFTKEEYIEKIKEYVEKNPELSAYRGGGFYRSVFDEVGPRKEDLDAIVSEKPLAVRSVDGHSIWVNSKALELAGITKETPDPPGGVIKRDPETGEPSGLLTESAEVLVRAILPKPTKEQYKQSLLWLQKWFNSVGLTSCHDAWVKYDPEYYNAYEELARDGQLSIRYRGSWIITPELVGGGDGQSEDFVPEMMLDQAISKGLELSKEFKTPYWQVNSFKFFADQVIEEETGYMKAPYRHRDDNWRGIKVWREGFLKQAFKRIDAAGFNIHTHQIGDAAAKYVLDALEYARAENGPRDSRHTFAHVQVIDREDVARMAEMGMTAAIAPYWSIIDDYFWELYYPYLGHELAYNGQYPAASLMEAGINTTFHCDFSVTAPDYGWAFYSAITRTQPDKVFRQEKGERAATELRTTDYSVEIKPGITGPLGKPEERLSLEQAIEAATINGAYAEYLENDLGSIEAGKLADMVVIDRNLFEVDVEDIPEMKVLMTFFEGKKVYSA